MCDAWYNGTGGSGLTTTVSWTMTDYSHSDWSSLGHSTSVKQASGGLFSFLSARGSSSSSETTFNGYTTSFNSKVTITLTMKGTPVIFNVNPGFWFVSFPRKLPFEANLTLGMFLISVPYTQNSFLTARTSSRVVYVYKRCSSVTKSASQSLSMTPLSGNLCPLTSKPLNQMPVVVSRSSASSLEQVARALIPTLPRILRSLLRAMLASSCFHLPHRG